jgi:hypothetical protein
MSRVLIERFPSEQPDLLELSFRDLNDLLILVPSTYVAFGKNAVLTLVRLHLGQVAMVADAQHLVRSRGRQRPLVSATQGDLPNRPSVVSDLEVGQRVVLAPVVSNPLRHKHMMLSRATEHTYLRRVTATSLPQMRGQPSYRERPLFCGRAAGVRVVGGRSSPCNRFAVKGARDTESMLGSGRTRELRSRFCRSVRRMGWSANLLAAVAIC